MQEKKKHDFCNIFVDANICSRRSLSPSVQRTPFNQTIFESKGKLAWFAGLKNSPKQNVNMIDSFSQEFPHVREEIHMKSKTSFSYEPWKL